MSDEHLVETLVSSRQVFEGKLLDVWQDDVRLPDGTPAVREYIRHPGAAVMVPILDDGQVLLLRQFRYSMETVMIELPAGKIDPGESSEDTASRELVEETGYSSANLQQLGTIHPCIGYSNEFIDVFLATALTLSSSTHHSGESLEPFQLPFDEALAWIQRGRITDAKSIISLYWAERELANRL